MGMKKETVAKQIYQTAHITGSFTLRSGQVSSEYFDKYLFEANPALLRAVAEQLLPLIPPETQVLAGLELGGVPVATALSLASGMPAAFVRKAAKKYGTCKLAEGAEVVGKQVCIIEDVITTGGQVIESVRELRQQGAGIDTVLCVILRNEKAMALLAAEGLRLLPAFTMDYIKACV